jgi:phage baseplate assembly protein V
VDSSLFREVRALLKPLERKLKLVASKAVLELVKDSAGLQQVQVSLLAGEVTDGAEHMQPGGLTHVPLPGAEGVYLTIGGVRDDGVVLAMSNRGNRVQGMQPGETALYSSGALPITIKLLIDGTLEIESPLKVTVKSPGIELSASGAPTQAFLGGTAAVAALNAVLTALNAYAAALGGIPGTPPATVTGAVAASAGATLITAIGTAQAALTAALSVVIKGE